MAQVEPGEDASAAALRELFEESGARGYLTRDIGRLNNPLKNTSTEYFTIFVTSMSDTFDESWRSRAFMPIQDALRKLIWSPASYVALRSAFPPTPAPLVQYFSSRASLTSLGAISQAWGGGVLSVSERGYRIETYIDGEHLNIAIAAPFFNDPLPPTPPGSTEGLWNFEVVEVFVARDDDDPNASPYLELEFGPHGHYLALTFSARRQQTGEGYTLWWRGGGG